MKRLLLPILLFVPILVNAQTKSGTLNQNNRQSEAISNEYKKSEAYKASRRLSAGGAMVAVGGGLLAGGLLLAVDMNDKGQKTAVRVMAAGGGLFMLIGGALIGSSKTGFFGPRATVGRTTFIGNGLVVNF